MTYLATLDLPLDTLTPYPGNPRRGNVPVIEESLYSNDQYRAVVVQAKDPADPAAGGTILAGNHTWIAARNIGFTTIRAELHQVNDETARRIVAVDNRAGDLGDYDTRLLAELLADMDDLAGTGYDPQDLDNLANLLNDDAWDQPKPASAGSDTEPDDSLFWPKITLTVPPDVFDAWRATLDDHDGDNDVAKLTAHLRTLGHL